MKKYLTFIMSCGILSSLLSCSTTQSLAGKSLDGEWNVIALSGQTPHTEEQPYIGFKTAEKQLFGNTGCNNIFGTLEYDGAKGTIAFKNIASTMKACMNDTFEYPFTQALGKVKNVKPLKNGEIGLYDENGELLISLKKR